MSEESRRIGGGLNPHRRHVTTRSVRRTRISKIREMKDPALNAALRIQKDRSEAKDQYLNTGQHRLS